MKPPFSLDRPVQTEDWYAARVVYVGAEGLYPVIALIKPANLEEIPFRYTMEGGSVLGIKPGRNLVNTPRTRIEWLNIYVTGVFSYSTHKQANLGATDDRIACIRIESTEGEGLDDEH
jgi:hypothetical protein